MSLPIAAGPSAYWYATRGAGIAALVLLTASVALGILDLSRWQSERWPRFVVDGVHRTVSLLAVALVAVHVVTTLLDGFTNIGLLDAFIPFASSYRPIWLGMGAVAFDLLLAVIATSLLRPRIGYPAWRAVHWASFACWPLALVHTLGTGTDAPLGWMLAISVICLLAVLVSVGWRISLSWLEGDRRRTLAASGIGAAVLATVIWTAGGPLGSDWAPRAGTPRSLLASFQPTTTTTAAAPPKSGPTLAPSFSAGLSGSVRQHQLPAAGLVDVDIRAVLHGDATGSLEIQIQGQPLGGGGVSMTGSRVSIGPPGDPLQYEGKLTSLSGTRLLASVSNGSESRRLDVRLSIQPGSRRLSGTVSSAPARSA